MSQTSVIFAALFVAFILFITARGELPSYIAVLTGNVKAPQQQASNDLGSQVLAGLETAGQIAALAG